mgnify:CR=1 FL=1
MDLKTLLASPDMKILKDEILRVAADSSRCSREDIERAAQGAFATINSVASCLRGLPLDALNPLLARDALIYVGEGVVESGGSDRLNIRTGTIHGEFSECSSGSDHRFYSAQNLTLGRPIGGSWGSSGRWTRKERRFRVIVAFVPMPDEPE